jgi:CRP-like cAMP-binding protein
MARYLLTLDDEALLSTVATPLSYSDGDTIIRQGERAPGVRILRTGAVRFLLPSQPRGPHIARHVAPVVLADSLLDGNRVAVCSVVADGDVQIDMIDGSRLESLLSRSTELSERFLRSLALMLLDNRAQVLSFALRPRVWESSA